ncbi:hypothetical protein GGQ67_002835 [Rhizobium metallidurans]|uniref:Uncharacterized protein n=1 Tax=Rhizobium metallidurans TaxID=1265931 RepID=A0A7W6CUL0_9HYPH|nr:hypothetical protein [Rhizobium metallidurans]
MVEEGEVRVSARLTAAIELAAPSSACRHLLPAGEKRLGVGRSLHLPFSPAGRRWPEGSDEGATRAESPTYGPAKITPLCPAGHLPHKGGDWLGSPARCDLNVRRCHCNDSISPLVGEMSGRTEGGIAPTELAAPSSGCRHLLPVGEKRLVAGRSLHLPFSPTGVRRTGRDQRLDPGQWPEGSDEGATRAGVTISRPAKAPRAAA